MFASIPKSKLIAALAILGSVAKDGKTVRITASAKSKSMTLSSRNGAAFLSLRLPEATVLADADTVLSYDCFKMSVSTLHGKVAMLSLDGESLTTSCETDINTSCSIAEKPSDAIAPRRLPKTIETIAVPTNFQNMLACGFQCVSDDKDRKALQGVNISSKGIAASDGRQLYHVPLPLHLESGITLPKSQAYGRLAGFVWKSLSVWKDGFVQFFRIDGDDFLYESAAIDGTYPNFLSVVPTSSSLDGEVEFDGRTAQLLAEFIRTRLKENESCRMTVDGHCVTFRSTEIHVDDETPELKTAARTNLAKGAVTVNCAYLSRLLKFGHNILKFNSKAHCPLLGQGGMGMYVFMPMRQDYSEPESSSAQAAASASAVPVVPAAISAPTKPRQATEPAPSNTIRTTSTKEKTTMIAQTTKSNVPAVVQRPISVPAYTPVVQAAPAVPEDPCDTLLSSLSELKTKVSLVESSLSDAIRKVREITSSHKAKERTYQDALRKLDRIRLAI